MEKPSPTEFLEAYRALTLDVEPAEEFLATIQQDALAELDRFGLVLLAPESFANGVARQILDYLNTELGLEVVITSAPIVLNADECNYMFVPSHNPSRFRFWLFTARFSLGPSVALIVKGPEESNVSKVLSDAKGFRVPDKAHSTSIRARFGAITGVMNLVHTADDFAHVLRNCLPFFSPVSLARVVNRALSAETSYFDRAFRTASTVLHSLESDVAHRQSFSRIIRALILQLGACAVPRDGATLPAGLIETAARFASVPPPASRFSFPVDSHPLLEIVAQSAGATGLKECARALLTREELHLQDWLRLIEQARAAGVRLDDAEALILMSGLYYADQELTFEILGVKCLFIALDQSPFRSAFRLSMNNFSR